MIPSLLESAARSLLVAGVVWIGLRAFRIRSVLAQKAVWGLVLAAAALMPLLLPLASRWQRLPISATLVLPRTPLKLLSEENPSQFPNTPSTVATYSPIAATVLPDATSSSLSAAPERARWAANRFPDPVISDSSSPERIVPMYAKPIVAQDRPVTLLELAWLLYLSVTAGLLLRLLYGLSLALRLWQSAQPVSMDAPRGTGSLRLRSSRAVASPVTIGSGIVLPADYVNWDTEKLRIVLAHERSHIRQGDFYLQLLAGLYAILFWFSPLGWWLRRRLSDLAEAISDRAGLYEAASRSSYAQILLEFAAKPRPTPIGVAMARSGHLSRRIDRLLNDSAFQQAFTASRYRVATAVLLVPIALFAATSLIRVQAAAQAPQQTAPSAQPAPPAQPPVVPEAMPAPPVKPATAQPTPPAAPIVTAPRVPVVPQVNVHVVVPPSPVGPIHIVVPKVAPVPPVAPVHTLAAIGPIRPVGPGVYSLPGGNMIAIGDQANLQQFTADGDPFVLVKRNGQKNQFAEGSARSHREEIEKAGKLAHGDFLWFAHNGKSYFIDDPAIVAEIATKSALQEALGKQQEALGLRQEALGKQQEELGRRQERASIPTPDMDKEIAEVEAAMAELKAKQGKSLTTEQWADIERKLGNLQGKLGAIQGKIGARQGALGAEQGKLGAQQGELGAEQGRLAEKQARLALETQQKMKSIIEQSLRNGKAHPVQ